jgi:phosphate transport system protein
MKKLERELESLKESVAEMGDLAQLMVAEAVTALFDPQNDSHYQRVHAEEERLDQMQIEIDREAIRVLTVYGPVAGNLRLVLSVSQINSQLERVGDQAVSMCNHIQLMASNSDATPLRQFEGMTKLVRTMLHETLKAFRLDDAAKARSTIASDNLVDVLNDEIVHDVLGSDTEQPSVASTRDIAVSVAQIMISQSLERIADQACNVCEQIIYMVEGADVRHQVEEHNLPTEPPSNNKNG